MTEHDQIGTCCIGDTFLQEKVARLGTFGACSICGEATALIAFPHLAALIDKVFQERLTPFHELSPDEISWVAKIAKLGLPLAAEVAEWICEQDEAEHEGGDGFYASGLGYVLDSPPYDIHEDEWVRFTNLVRRDARYFNRAAQDWLDRLFTGLLDRRTVDGMSVIVDLAPGVGHHIIRARVALDEGELYDILLRPVIELGPRPPGEGRAGRLNPNGISVFYGATETETCISEIRPPVGAFAVVGRFDVIRPLCLLDFDKLAAAVGEISHFDPEYWAARHRLEFLQSFGQRIARPVLPRDEEAGYLPTQMVADYLAQSFPTLDGLLYASTQTDKAGRNVMLFARAARVQPFDHSLYFVEPDLSRGDGYDEDDRILIDVKSIAGERHRMKRDRFPLDLPSIPDPADQWLPASFAQPDFDDARVPSLALDLTSLAVRRIAAIRYCDPPRTTEVRLADDLSEG